MTPEIEPDLDLSDLDLLDDQHAHARCLICYPVAPPGSVFIALCGRRTLAWGRLGDDDQQAPPDACPDCKRVWAQPCQRCGAS